MSGSFSAQKGTPGSKRRSGTGDTSFRATTPRAAVSPAPTPLQTVTSSNMPGISAVDASFLEVPIFAPRASTPRAATPSGHRSALAAAADNFDNEDAELESVTQGPAAKRNTFSFTSIPPRGVAGTSDSFEQQGKKVSDNYLTWDKKLTAMQETVDTLVPQKKQEIIDALYLYIQGTNFKGVRSRKPTTITGLFRELRERYTDAKAKRDADAKFEIIEDFAAAYASVERIAERKIRSVALPAQVTPSSATPTGKSRTSTPSHGALRPPSPRKAPSRGTSPAPDLLSRRLEDSFGDEDPSLGDSCDRAQILIARLEEAKTNYKRLTAATRASAASRSDRGTINTAINTIIEGFIKDATTQVNAITRHKGGTDLKLNYAKLRDLNYQIEDLIEAYYVVLKDAARTDLLIKHYAAQRDKFYQEESERQRRQAGSRSGGAHINVANIKADLRYTAPDEIVQNLQVVLDNLMLSFNKSYTSHDKLKDVYKQIYLIQKEERKELIALLEDAKMSLQAAEVQIENKVQIIEKIDNYIQELKDANLRTKDPIFARSGSKRQTTPDGYYLEMNVLARDALLSKVASFYNSVRLVLNGGKVESLDVDIQAEPLVEALEPIVLSIDKFIAIIAELKFHRKQVAALWKTSVLLNARSAEEKRQIEIEYQTKTSQIEEAFGITSRLSLHASETMDAERIEELHNLIHAQQKIMSQDLQQIKDLPAHLQALSSEIADLRTRLTTVDNTQDLAEIYGRINEVHSQLINDLKTKIAEYGSADASAMLKVLRNQLNILNPDLSRVKDQREKALAQIKAIQDFSNDQARHLEILPLLQDQTNYGILREAATKAMNAVAGEKIQAIAAARQRYAEALNAYCDATINSKEGNFDAVIRARDVLRQARIEAGVQTRGELSRHIKPTNLGQSHIFCRAVLGQEMKDLYSELDFAMQHIASTEQTASLKNQIRLLKEQLRTSLNTQATQVTEALRSASDQDRSLVGLSEKVQTDVRILDRAFDNDDARNITAIETAEKAHSANAETLINFYKTRLAQLQRELAGLRADKDKGLQDGSTAAEQARAVKAADDERIAELEREIARLNAIIKKNVEDLSRIRDERDRLKAMLREMGVQASMLRETVIEILESQQSYFSKIQPQPRDILTPIAAHLEALKAQKAQRDAATATAAASASPQRRGSPESDSIAEAANMPAIRDADNLAHANAQKILELEIAKLQAEKATSEADRQAKAQEIAALKAELEVLRRQNPSQAIQELAEAKAQLAIAHAEIAQLKAREAELAEELRAVKVNRDDLAQQLQAVRLEIASLGAEVASKNDFITDLRQQLADMRGERDQAVKARDDIAKQLQDALAEAARLRAALEASLAREQVLRGQLGRAQEDIAALQTQLAAETAAKEAALRRVEELGSGDAGWRTERSQWEQTITTLRTNNTDLVRERDEARNALNALRLEMATLRAQHAALTAERDRLQQRVTQLEAENRAGIDRENRFQTEITTLRQQLATAGDDNTAILRRLHDQLQQALRYAGDKVAEQARKDNLNVGDEHQQDLAQRLQVMSRRISDIIGDDPNRPDAIPHESLPGAQNTFAEAVKLLIKLRERQKNYAADQLALADARMRAAEGRIQEHQDEATRAARETAAANARSEELQQQLNALQPQYTAAIQARDAALQMATQATQRADGLQIEVTRLTGENARLTERVRTLEVELQRVQTALAQAEADRTRLAAENQRLQNLGRDTEASRALVAQKDEEIARLNAAMRDLQQRFDAHRSTLEDIRRQLGQAQREKAASDRATEEALARAREYEVRITEIASERETIRDRAAAPSVVPGTAGTVVYRDSERQDGLITQLHNDIARLEARNGTLTGERNQIADQLREAQFRIRELETQLRERGEGGVREVIHTQAIQTDTTRGGAVLAGQTPVQAPTYNAPTYNPPTYNPPVYGAPVAAPPQPQQPLPPQGYSPYPYGYPPAAAQAFVQPGAIFAPPSLPFSDARRPEGRRLSELRGLALPAAPREFRDDAAFEILPPLGHRFGQPLVPATDFLFRDAIYRREAAAGRKDAVDFDGHANIVANDFLEACNKILKYQNDVGLRGSHPQTVHYFRDLWQNTDRRFTDYQLTAQEMRTFITMMCYFENQHSAVPDRNVHILNEDENILSRRNQRDLQALFTEQMAKFCAQDYLEHVNNTRNWGKPDERSEHRGEFIPHHRERPGERSRPSETVFNDRAVPNLFSYLREHDRERAGETHPAAARPGYARPGGR